MINLLEPAARIELATSSLPRKRSTPELRWRLYNREIRGLASLWRYVGLHLCGAEDEVRTRDPQLGRLMLYRLSYFRVKKWICQRSRGD